MAAVWFWLSNLVGLAGLVAGLRPNTRWPGRVLGWLAVAGAAWGLIASGKVTGLQQFLNGVFLGSIYALIALGYTMVYGVLRLINFAHGEVFMIGAYIAWFALAAYQRQPTTAVAVALLAAMVGCAALGLLVERVAYRPLRRAPRLAALITAIGVSLLLQNLSLLIFSAKPKTIPPVVSSDTLKAVYTATGLTVNAPALVTVAAAFALMLGLRFFVATTKLGRAMRAVSEDREAAQLMGINVDFVIAATFAIGSALAGAGGVLYGLRYQVIKADMGVLPGLKAFVAAVLGGIGSIQGAMVGAFLIGVVEVAVAGVSVSPQQIATGSFLALLLLAFWRLSQHWVAGLPRTPQATRLLALGWALLAAACGVVARCATLPLKLSPERSVSGSTFQDAAVFAILVVILIVKPTGLMGRFAPEKV